MNLTGAFTEVIKFAGEPVSSSTQNQALSAILFLYRDVLSTPLPWLDGVERAKPSTHLPVVFTPQEVRSLLAHLSGTNWLMASLLYGSGLRPQECVTLRVKDTDFGYGQITVRDCKGAKDRVTLLPPRSPAHCRPTWPGLRPCTSTTSRVATGARACPTRWPASTRRPTASGAGSTPSPPPDSALTSRAAGRAGSTPLAARCRRPSRERPCFRSSLLLRKSV